jgi:hypothetical protein
MTSPIACLVSQGLAPSRSVNNQQAKLALGQTVSKNSVL